MSFLGFNFSKNKGTSSSTSNMSKNETTNQEQNRSGTTTTTGSQSTSQTGTSAGTSTTNQTNTQNQTGTKTSGQQGRTSLFSDDILSGIEGMAMSLLAGNSLSNPATGMLGSFDAQGFIDGMVSGAEAKAAESLDIASGGLGDVLGGRAGNNSMASLMYNRAASDAAAGVAQVGAQAAQTAATIQNQNAQTMLAGQQVNDSRLQSILNVLKGGAQLTSQTGTESSTGSATNTGTGSTSTNETTNQNTQTTTEQKMMELINTLLKGTTATVGISNETGKTTGTQFGVSGQFGK